MARQTKWAKLMSASLEIGSLAPMLAGGMLREEVRE